MFPPSATRDLRGRGRRGRGRRSADAERGGVDVVEHVTLRDALQHALLARGRAVVAREVVERAEVEGDDVDEVAGRIQSHEPLGRAEQSGAERSRAEQSRAGREGNGGEGMRTGREGNGREEKRREEKSRAEQSRAEQTRAEKRRGEEQGGDERRRE